MKHLALAILLSTALSACAAAPQDARAPTAESTIVSVIGTPFLIAFKIPVCAVTLAAAAPAAGMIAMVPPEDVPEPGKARQVLADGVRANCGPPYAIAP
jgi:class 3 adenylate cyclase